MTRAAILNTFNPETFKGGIETFVLNLKHLLESRDIETDLHYMSPSATLPIDKFPVHAAKKIIPPFLLECYMLGKAFSHIEQDYDLIISNNFYGIGYFPKKSKAFNIYHSTHAGYAEALKREISKSEFRDLKYFYGHIGDRLSGRGKIKIAVSNSVKSELQRHYGFKDITVVNHGIETEFYKKIDDVQGLRNKWGIVDDAFTGIFVGRWEIGKGISLVEKTIGRHPDILWLLIIGNSECQLSDLPNVRIIKNADKKTMLELYSLADFILFPSYYEGFGLVIAEAMSCGLPVICTEVGIVKDLLIHHGLRYLIIPSTDNSETVNSISKRIATIRADSKFRTQISERSREVIMGCLSIDKWQRDMANALGIAS